MKLPDFSQIIICRGPGESRASLWLSVSPFQGELQDFSGPYYYGMLRGLSALGTFAEYVDIRTIVVDVDGAETMISTRPHAEAQLAMENNRL